jgi:Polyketide cyclase / dehydrase and lipid transport
VAISIGIGILVLIFAAIAFIATRPTNSCIQRSAQINAPGDVVFSIINDLHRWGQWSPYDKRDPNMKKTFAGPSAGPGATYTWNGNNHVGEGRLTIVESKPGQLVSMKLEFSRPFKANNQVNFRLVPSEGGTRVSWIMDGKNNFITKAMSLIMNMDKMVGTDFEQGLSNLKTVAQEETQRIGQGARANAQVG